MQAHLRCELEPSGLPAVLLPSRHSSRATQRSIISRRIARLWQLLLVTLAAAALTGFLRQALA
jgi:hypothetical protein